MKVVVAAFNQEKSLLGAFSVIVQPHRLIVYSTTKFLSIATIALAYQMMGRSLQSCIRGPRYICILSWPFWLHPEVTRGWKVRYSWTKWTKDFRIKNIFNACELSIQFTWWKLILVWFDLIHYLLFLFLASIILIFVLHHRIQFSINFPLSEYRFIFVFSVGFYFLSWPASHNNRPQSTS